MNCLRIKKKGEIDSSYIRRHYAQILQFFQWMDIDEKALLYGVDHIESIADTIDTL